MNETNRLRQLSDRTSKFPTLQLRVLNCQACCLSLNPQTLLPLRQLLIDLKGPSVGFFNRRNLRKNLWLESLRGFQEDHSLPDKVFYFGRNRWDGCGSQSLARLQPSDLLILAILWLRVNFYGSRSENDQPCLGYASSGI